MGQVGNTRHVLEEVNNALSMIEYLTALSLFFLVVAQIILLKKCTQFADGIEPSAENLSSEMKGITQILDDIADLINDSLNLVANSPITQTPSNPMQSILTGLISNMTMPNHGDPQQTRTIQEINTPTQSETENKFD